ncbi:hypothetical protein EVG20_g7647 [Dentipellis fragilis]|uniref:NAD-dependent epimerase/dehydratase domain-containing protein n=1 Tax=Dentipellis fragilis TaxID=205917 RepID=A0A4Y9YFY6_9AGAM|nr:hypothetical protein EVG20_g7647 [Dentipellis fragilis]
MAQVILVTGASGFLAAHIIDQLLDAGYRVRGTARSPKMMPSRKHIPRMETNLKSQLSTISPPFASAQTTSSRSGITALIHVAATLSQDRSTEALLQRVPPPFSSLETSGKISPWTRLVGWNPRTREDALQPNADRFTVFAVAKKLTEQEVWAFAREHPDIDVVVILCSWILGPHSPHHIDAASSMKNGTNRYFYRQINGFEGRPFSELAKSLSYMFPAFVHVSDAARAHVLVLKAMPSLGPKRVILNSGYMLLKVSMKHTVQTRPKLRSRLPDMSSAPKDPEMYVKFDVGSADRILGMKTFKTWQETVKETG